MEVFYHFECFFPAVFTVNGVFFESITKLKAEPSDSLFITVFPLDAVYLPYTVRLGGGEAFANAALTKIVRLRENRFLVRFLPRFNYVYSPVRHEPANRNGSVVKRLFEAVKERDLTAARSLLTEELSASVDDNSLLEFFDGYEDMVDNNGYVSACKDSFFLVPESGKVAELFKVRLKNGLIDNLEEV